jgi:hypothetical protein
VKHERRQNPKSKRFEMLWMASVSNGLTNLPTKSQLWGALGKLSFDWVNEETQEGWGCGAILHSVIIRQKILKK